MKKFAFLFALLLPMMASAGVYEDMEEAIIRGDSSDAIALLKRGMDVNSVDRDGNTLLIQGIRRNMPEFIDYLVKHRARLNLRNKNGESALSIAAFLGQLPQVKLLVEHLNSRDMTGFSLTTTAQVLSVLDEVGHSNAFLQYDVYHAQRMEGELANIYRTNKARISHIQIADNPGRHQPGSGEINYPWLIGDLMASGYAGYLGLEYIPTPDSVQSLAWVSEYGYAL